jgi:hypothetical protein
MRSSEEELRWKVRISFVCPRMIRALGLSVSVWRRSR